jgi:hypothetical protein
MKSGAAELQDAALTGGADPGLPVSAQHLPVFVLFKRFH